ncbi:MAG: hypothetical protein A2846_00680 [Candidatus Doudnabacteria bacterium RIFCSPHIGHO2_01_FULL_49_9]|uniref:Type II secretion system protein J n=1 Tax=Candidatus Doudnabacteria bacterium RIFCSPHIGHO2_01_FULL_49_9 TaxID=1817827 RepID=A0A1F5NYY0_9BACT|nr:MAG: hypothetical protein A2846_00680 [Candidatus Doudnabacteria bacterium RIFCSPHIGHO2_01_FULL_49_9]
MNKSTFHIPHSTFQRGFTLVEALVSAAVFAVCMSSIVGIYVSLQKINQRSAAIQAVAQNARFVHEDLTKLLANGWIDYSRYSSGTVPQPDTDELNVIDRLGEQVRIFFAGDVLYIEKGPAGAGYISAFTGSDVKVLDWRIYITPATNPFPVGGANPQEQPAVGVFLDLESNLDARERARQSFQTTITTRQYPD